MKLVLLFANIYHVKVRTVFIVLFILISNILVAQKTFYFCGPEASGFISATRC